MQSNLNPNPEEPDAFIALVLISGRPYPGSS
jgi:hypothetical protein